MGVSNGGHDVVLQPRLIGQTQQPGFRRGLRRLQRERERENRWNLNRDWWSAFSYQMFVDDSFPSMLATWNERPASASGATFSERGRTAL